VVGHADALRGGARGRREIGVVFGQ
jgi:hypothetical protein